MGAWRRTKRSRALAVLLAVGLIGIVGTVTFTSTVPRAATAESRPQAAADRPNIVFILTDDLSKNLVRYMSSVRAMKNRGTTFSNYFVSDSLCCPSRSNILTGLYPHNTHVLVNQGGRDDYEGGAAAFNKHGNQHRTYAVALDRHYRTGFMGKYLNGYSVRDRVPPGWDEWHMSGNGYDEMPHQYNITGVRKKGGPKNIENDPKLYLNDLLGIRAKKFVNRAHDRGQPFFLTLSSFAPHQQVDDDKPLFPAARRDRPSDHGGVFAHGDCGTKPSGGRFDCARIHVDSDRDKLNKMYRDRIRMMQSLNDRLQGLRSRLRTIGELRNTYFVFASDNGYHLDEHGLRKGKGSPYDHDTRVPLIIEGPGVEAGKVRTEVTQTVDLYATFQQMARLDPKPSNGHGLLDLAKGADVPHWRHAALFEHKPQSEQSTLAEDPDLDSGNTTRSAGFNPAFTSYKAIRTENWLFVRYKDRKNHLYDLRNDAGQHSNVIADHRKKAGYLESWLTTYAQCGKADTKTCWKASHAPPTG